MASDTATSSAALEQFQASLASYYLYTGREQGPLIEDRGRKVRFELHRQFKDLARPPAALRAQLQAIAANRGLKRRPGPDSLIVSTDEEIRLRIRSLKFLSASFLIRGWRARPTGQNARYTATASSGATIGAATVATNVGRADPYVALTSLLEGAVEQNNRRHIVDRALLAQAADMETYLARKHAEKQRELFRATLNTAFTRGA